MQKEPPEPQQAGETEQKSSPPKRAPSFREGVDHLTYPLDAFVELRLPWWKRIMDVAGAGLGLVIVFPFMLVVAAAIKLTSRGPVIFSQQRAGLGGKPFTFYKFRSMYDGAEEQKNRLIKYNEQTGPVFKMQHDPRYTPIGRLLRQWSIDELPQLWNVMTGDMSLVGPRPLPCDESKAASSWQRRRVTVTPGLTCIWQVSGRSLIDFEDWARLDIRYIESRSFWLDLKILLLTLPAVVSRIGAH